MSRTVAFASDKGGAGKTTASTNIGAAAAETGQRVLVVDTDNQAGATAALGVRAGKPTIYEVLGGRNRLADAIRPTVVDGLDVLAADTDLAALQIELPRRDGWRFALRDALATVADRYDLVIIDTPPGLNVMTFLGLVAAEQVVVTCNASFPDLRVVANVFDTVAQADKVARSGVSIVGIIPSKVGRRTNHRDEILTEMTTRWPELILTALPERVAFQDAAIAGQAVTVYAPHSPAADAVRTVTQEVLARVTPT